MSMKNSPSSVTNGLVFHYDMNNPKSWKGKPTTNYAYDQNPRIDTTYASRIYTSANTYPVHHPDGITVYNPNGSNISDYVNTGVTDWTNTYHAIWTYDRALRKPVITMRDVDAAWKAKSFGLSIGGTPTAMGLGYGDLYTISWLQWTDNISKSVNAGMYGANTSGVNNFHDGLSQSAYDSTYAFNTKPYTWQRVWATFQVNATRNLSSWWGCYMYGYFNTRNTVKIADVQIETGYVSPLVENGASTRTNTQALLDLTGRNTITVAGLTYAADGLFSFNGSSDYVTTPLSLGSTDPIVTINMWIKRTADFNGAGYWGLGGGSSNNGINGYTSVTNKIGWDLWGQTTFHTGQDYPLNQWVNVCWVKTAATFTTSTLKVYINGVEYPLTTTIRNNSSSVNLATGFTVGRLSNSVSAYYAPGQVGTSAVYNRALSAEEIQQNFNALRGRYGI